MHQRRASHGGGSHYRASPHLDKAFFNQVSILSTFFERVLCMNVF